MSTIKIVVVESKPYLTTVMQNDLTKPWKRLQLPPKRVSVPKSP